ncbi:uncharacterized protein LOC112588504 [Harpegnathos saltator]|uniref:uncharacterized protein LOC112588504 n=1 Tax=Harpegnathos saltator TaxID=610380 RepID=UPI000DBED845|nr:uncharacterized protein LOC112588504 [Harpegnathos saltator]
MILAPVKDCIARWQTLRERFTKEKRILEQERRSGAAASTRPEWPTYSAMSFLTPHIRKRKSVDNFPPMSSVLISSARLSCRDEEMSLLPSLAESSDNVEILEEQTVDDLSAPVNVPFATYSALPSSSSGSSTAASMLYLGPTGRFAPPIPSLPSIDINDPDVSIGKNVESCLKNLKNIALKLKYRKKFRSIIQNCEEEAEDLKITN